jgi:molybdenum cofactor synthesis domain-containing protein
MNIGLLTISDRGAAGAYEDRSGPLMAQILAEQTPWAITHRAIVSDDQQEIAAILRAWAGENLNLILTSGGTGFAPRDITPEATRQVIEREAPGIAEALRAAGMRVTLHAMLSRGVAGLCGQTLIVNLPGNPKAVRENLAVLLPILPHALDLAAGAPGDESGHRTV